MAWFSKLFGNEERAATAAYNIEDLIPKVEAYIESIENASRETQTDSKNVVEAPRIQFSVRDNYSRDNIRASMKQGSLSRNMDWTNIERDIGSYLNVGFVEQMLEFIEDKGLKDSTVYKAAQIDRRLFSKIVSDRSYKPAKDTCIAIALALALTPSEAEDLLSRAGYTLSHSNKRDVIFEYCFHEKIYEVTIVNDLLFRLGQKTLGR